MVTGVVVLGLVWGIGHAPIALRGQDLLVVCSRVQRFGLDNRTVKAPTPPSRTGSMCST